MGLDNTRERRISVFAKSVFFILLISFLSYAVLATAAEYADDEELEAEHQSIVPVSTDLALDASRAQNKKIPILLVFSAEHCEFCHLLEREILDPMYISGDYEDKVLIRRVMTDSSAEVRNFQGKLEDVDKFSNRYSVQVTPTVMLVDYDGNELAPRVLGVNTVDLYSAYLDEAILLSRDELLRQTKAN